MAWHHWIADETIKIPLNSSHKNEHFLKTIKINSSNNLGGVKEYFVNVSTFRNLLDQYVLCVYLVKFDENVSDFCSF